MLGLETFGYSYRHSARPADVSGPARPSRASGRSPGDRRAHGGNHRAREATQPIREKTGGSTFKNPPGDSAWRLIDAAGWRGRRLGGAMFSPLHANFMINTGEATAADIEALGEEARGAVRAKFGVELEWEIRRIGRP